MHLSVLLRGVMGRRVLGAGVRNVSRLSSEFVLIMMLVYLFNLLLPHCDTLSFSMRLKSPAVASSTAALFLRCVCVCVCVYARNAFHSIPLHSVTLHCTASLCFYFRSGALTNSVFLSLTDGLGPSAFLLLAGIAVRRTACLAGQSLSFFLCTYKSST